MKIATYVAGALSFSATMFASLASAHSYPSCAFEIFRPAPLAEEIANRLAYSDVAVVNQGLDAGTSTNRSLLVRGNSVVGKLLVDQDVRHATAEVTVLDAEDHVLLNFKERRFVCVGGTSDASGGLCSTVEGYTELEPIFHGHKTYEVSFTADDSIPAYYRYGDEITNWNFRRELSDSLNWLGATLASTSTVSQPVMLTATDRLYWAMASEPAVSPYLSQLTIKEEAGSGRLVLTGVVPSNFVYDRIVDAAHDAGLWNLQPWLVIDTRTALPPNLGPSLSTCH